jgi:rare lipoprotein A
MKGAKVTRQKELNDQGDSAVVYYGVASYYADKFTGRETASGEIYSPLRNTAACNVLPLGTWIRVTNLRNDKSIILKINDRLHAKNNRLVDLTKSAAQKLGYTGRGLTRVKVEVLGKKKPND